LNYIKKLQIENFQSHQYSEIEFDEGLNVIVGPSDQGKSAIIRAIKWVLFNEPRGSDFIRHGASFARVAIEMSNGFIITRERSASKNRYAITTPEGETAVFEGFGNDAPEEIKKAHGIYKIMIDTDSSVSLNLGEQLEGPFLLSETGSVRAKAIGRLTGVHVVDKAIRDTVSDIKKENQIESKSRAEITEIEKRLSAYQQLEQLKIDINKKEKILEKVEVIQNRFEKVLTLKKTQDQLKIDIESNVKTIEQYKNLNQAEPMIVKLSEQMNILNKIKNFKANINAVSFEISSQKNILDSTKLLEAAQYSIESLEKKISQSKILVKLKDEYEKIESSLSEGKKYLEKSKAEIENIIQNYAKQLKKLSKCPVCFSSIDDSIISNIILQAKEETHL
jgi:exonuclease SbcC